MDVDVRATQDDYTEVIGRTTQEIKSSSYREGGVTMPMDESDSFLHSPHVYVAIKFLLCHFLFFINVESAPCH